ncbi:hypothetical protein PV08_10043 [Exophiala spinifera]|uniref:RZ-type domain-containing protein n=1 Tax=Exophiala spinifera TaxID=91928 RepID=A0A0D2BHB9_9EURO|nr:uncharacterized protein PV08_10043 [Exophiala spinifera]KIW10744.1 hypothetical protein PV08_10043 [Exophiala spinifera]
MLPPLYTRQPGFRFSLSPLLKGAIENDGDLWIDLASSPDNSSLIDEMEDQTGLDRGQCRALLAALTQEYALIQGPPGTGKSYLGVQLIKVLMKCKQTAALGPVVVVCYTNHALDQFLEHLLGVGIKKIVRIGGQSQSHLLEDHNLRKISQTEGKTRSEKYLAAKHYEALDHEANSISRDLGRMHGLSQRWNWANFAHYIQRKYPRIGAQFRKVDEEGFKAAGRHPFEQWAPSAKSVIGAKTVDDPSAMAVDQLDTLVQKAENNVHSLSLIERRILLQFWSQQVHEEALDNVFERVKEADSIQRHLTNIHDEVDRRVLQNADVIGLTTTGLAKRISTLKRIRCKIVICEEAGEVMEAHMISALLPTVEHFIQIGDHEQLRPQINNFRDLSLESKQGVLYQLDRSQFERLSIGQPGRPRIPVAQLNVQRRMRPEIASLVRETLYPDLSDHVSTTDLPDVVGMRKNLFWLDHDHVEEGQHSETHHKSHSNMWEVEMVHAMVRHVVRQGVYRSSDIAVLTPYTGQLSKLRAAMRNDFEIVLSDRDQEALEKDGFNPGASSSSNTAEDQFNQPRKASLEKKKLSELLRVATVDNFQGEEAKIIIVSLVRSNKEKRVGFLKTTNRINVLLSRAQHGMYLVGNVDTYSKIHMWQKIIDMLRKSDSIGSSLGLCCPRHKDTPLPVSEPDDFSRLSPEGGCRLSCSWRLPDCGHMCQARCHSESMHNVFLCHQPCQRLHEPCKHACQKTTCGEDCGKCCVKLKDVLLPCGHSKDNILCHQAQNPATIRCDALVAKMVPGCDHTVEIACHLDVSANQFQCPTHCAAVLSCGHPCRGTCGQCNTTAETGNRSISHQTCRKVCGRASRTCNHLCSEPCHEGRDCAPCSLPCEVRCQHSGCMLPCHEACAPCIERCTWSCEHQGSCTMPCSAPCNRLPCDERCTKTLPCGHQCPGLCGETCSEEHCQQCGMMPDSRVDLLEMKTYAEIDVDETPIVVLGCGHFFTAETLDGLVGMKDVYIADTYGHFTGFADISGALASQIPRCPDCKRPVRQYATRRYNRLINRAVIDEMSKRFHVAGKTELRRLELQLDKLEKELESSRSNITLRLGLSTEANDDRIGFSTIRGKQIQERYKSHIVLYKDIKAFLQNSADSHQPAQKLYEAQIHAARTKLSASVEEALTSLSIHESVCHVERDRRIALGGRLTQIKADCIVLEDKFCIVEATGLSANTLKLPGGSPEKMTKPYLQVCAMFIKDCNVGNLAKLAVEASLYFARIVRLYRSCRLAKSDSGASEDYSKQARELLEQAVELCKQPFQNAEQLRAAAEESIKLLQREWYEAVSSEELDAIKRAMVSGPGGIATHSGHWYNCIRGHPFAIGECGMPMEEARCPECGAPIGGSHHQAVAGVTRAIEMES